MNYFLSWCRPLLIAFLFHVVTSLLPPSFHRNDFSTCFTPFFILGQKPHKHFVLVISHRAHSKHAHARTDNKSSRRIHVHAHVNDVVQCLLVWRPTIYCIDVRLECNNHSMSVHTPSTVETDALIRCIPDLCCAN